MLGITRLKVSCAVALILLIALVAASPAAALLGEGSPLLPNTGNIRGTITDQNGVPVDNLEVCAMTEQTQPFSITYCSRTEEGGQYLITNVPQQGYKVWAHAAWYLGFTENYPQVYYPGVKHYEESTWVQVHGEQTTTGIDFQVHEGGEISGTVTAKGTGKPIAGIQVCPTWVSGHERAEEHSCGITDAAGAYRFKNVDTGEYTVKFDTQWNPEYEHYQYPEALEFETAFYKGATEVAEATPVSVTAGQSTEGIDAQLQPVDPAPPAHDVTPPATEAETPQASTQPSVPVGVPGTRPRLSCRKGKRKVMKAGHLRCVRIHHSAARRSHR